MREAQIAARLQHPHIVTVYDVGTHEGQPFIAMEYIAGETLGELIRRRAPLALSRKIELMADVCEGLAYAHKRGVVHRDVKPANLMVSRESGNVKILDFGIARQAGSNLTQIGMVMGTPNYMSPEQIAGQAIDHRSDIFAVGTVLYELLVNRQAFGGESPHAVLLQISTVDPPRVSSLNSELDPELDRIIDRAMAKAPGDRYPDLQLMRADLLRVTQRLEAQQEGHTIVGEPDEPPARQTPTPTPRTGRPGPDRARIAERREVRIATHLQSGEAALAAGELEEALAQVDLAAEIEPDDPRIVRLHERVRTAIDTRDCALLVRDARQNIAAGALTAAGRLLADATQLAPADPEVQALARSIERAFEQRERQREQARKAREAVALARDYLEHGALDAALRATGEALGYRPDDADAIEVRQTIRTAIDRRNQAAIDDARQQAANGRLDSAINMLQALRPADDLVIQALSELEEARAAAERDRAAREQAAREQAAREHAAREEEARARLEQERSARAREDAARADDERRRAFDAWVESQLQAIDTALDDARWSDAHELLFALEGPAPNTPRLPALRERLAQGLESERRLGAVQRLLAEARSCLRAGEHDEAERAVREASRLDPGNADAAALAREISTARVEAEQRGRETALLLEAQRVVEEAEALASAGDYPGALTRLDSAPAVPLVDEALARISSARRRHEQDEAARRLAEEEASRRADLERQRRLEQERQQALEAEERREVEEQQRQEAETRAREAAAERERQRAEAARRKADAAAETRRRELETRANRAIAQARKEFGRGRHDRAIASLERFTPAHPAVTDALEALRTEQRGLLPRNERQTIPDDDSRTLDDSTNESLSRPPVAPSVPVAVTPASTAGRTGLLVGAAIVAVLVALGAWLWLRPSPPPEPTSTSASQTTGPSTPASGPQTSGVQPPGSQATAPPQGAAQPPGATPSTQTPTAPPASSSPTTQQPPIAAPVPSPDAERIARGAALLARGQLPDAIREAVEGLRLAPSSEPLQSLRDRTMAAARLRADNARLRSIQAGATNQTAHQQATRQLTDADRRRVTGPGQAVDLYLSAETAFTNAITAQGLVDEQARALTTWAESRMADAFRAANAQRWDEAATIVSEIRGKAPDTAGLDDLGVRIEAGRRARATPPTTTPAAPPARTTPAPVQTTDEIKRDITAMFTQYLAAWNARDAARARALHPELPVALATSFDQFEEQRASCSEIQWQLVTPSQATFRCTWMVEVRGSRRGGGTPPAVSRPATFVVVRSGAGWIINSRTFQ
jgi:hypothetical protein